MIDGMDPTQIVACAIRPAGSWIHLLTLVAFVFAAGAVAPRTPARAQAPS
jgi:hypothetical protein